MDTNHKLNYIIYSVHTFSRFTEIISGPVNHVINQLKNVNINSCDHSECLRNIDNLMNGVIEFLPFQSKQAIAQDIIAS